MKMSQKLHELLERAKKTDVYWVTRAKLDFSQALDVRRRRLQISYAAIAEKIGSSAPYVSKVFRGDSNLTIESMVKLAHATGGRLDIRIVDAATSLKQWDIAHLAAVRVPAPATTSATYELLPPANGARFRFEDSPTNRNRTQLAA